MPTAYLLLPSFSSFGICVRIRKRIIPAKAVVRIMKRFTGMASRIGIMYSSITDEKDFCLLSGFISDPFFFGREKFGLGPKSGSNGD